MDKQIICIMILLILNLSIMGCIEDFKKDDKGITSLEGLDIAKKRAFNWSQNATLISVWAGSDMLSKGHFSSWYYKYVSINQNSSTVKKYQIKVCSDGKYDSEVIEGTLHRLPIVNWTVDSDKAYEIAKDNKKISKYLSKYEQAEVDSFSISRVKNETDPVWKIDWLHSTGLESPVSARIIINAHTGEVLHAEADA